MDGESGDEGVNEFLSLFQGPVAGRGNAIFVEALDDGAVASSLLNRFPEDPLENGKWVQTPRNVDL